MKKNNLFLLFGVGIMFAGCSSNVDYDNAILDLELSEKSTNEIAAEYVQNQLKMDFMCSSRDLKNEEYPPMLYDLSIVDDDGNELFFADFSDELKKDFYSIWKDVEVNTLVLKLEENPPVQEMLKLENKAFELTEQNCSRRVCNNPEAFIAKYAENMELLLNKSKARNVVTGGEITKDCLVQDSVNKFKANYKKGRVVVSPDSSSASSAFATGHASMMCESVWNTSWNINGLGKATITAFPINNGSTWEGKIDGVQYEPIGMWAGNSSGSSEHTSIYNVGRSTFVWNWFKSYYAFSNASDEDYNNAADYAIANERKPYNWNFGLKDREDKFYCSQLCYKAWKKQSKDYDISMGLIASPANIVTSHNVSLVAAYSNK